MTNLIQPSLAEGFVLPRAWKRAASASGNR